MELEVEIGYRIPGVLERRTERVLLSLNPLQEMEWSTSFRVEKDRVELWWPNGRAERMALYDVAVDVSLIAGEDQLLIDEVKSIIKFHDD